MKIVGVNLAQDQRSVTDGGATFPVTPNAIHATPDTIARHGSDNERVLQAQIDDLRTQVALLVKALGERGELPDPVLTGPGTCQCLACGEEAYIFDQSVNMKTHESKVRYRCRTCRHEFMV